MQATAEMTVNFTGILVKRYYRPDHKYVQLVFQTAEGARLSLSRNLTLVRSLRLGQTYRVSGQKYTLGRKSYIHEPTAVPVQPATKFTRKRTKLLVIGLVATLLIGAIGAAVAMAYGKAGNAPASTNQGNVESSQATAGPTSLPVNTEVQAATTDTPAAQAPPRAAPPRAPSPAGRNPQPTSSAAAAPQPPVSAPVVMGNPPPPPPASDDPSQGQEPPPGSEASPESPVKPPVEPN